MLLGLESGVDRMLGVCVCHLLCPYVVCVPCGPRQSKCSHRVQPQAVEVHVVYQMKGYRNYASIGIIMIAIRKHLLVEVYSIHR